MKINVKGSVICVMLLALGACGTTPAPKTPRVETEMLTYEMRFGGRSTAAPSELDGLDTVMDSIHPSAVSYIGVATEDRGTLSMKRANYIRRHLVREGYDRYIFHLIPSENITPGTVTLTVRYSIGIAPEPCPDWSKNSIIDYQNAGGSNFGCAAGNNLIMQLANPADYNGGRGRPVSDSARDSAGLQRYMSGAASPGGTSGSAASTGAGTTTTTSSTP